MVTRSRKKRVFYVFRCKGGPRLTHGEGRDLELGDVKPRRGKKSFGFTMYYDCVIHRVDHTSITYGITTAIVLHILRITEIQWTTIDAILSQEQEEAWKHRQTSPSWDGDYRLLRSRPVRRDGASEAWRVVALRRDDDDLIAVDVTHLDSALTDAMGCDDPRRPTQADIGKLFRWLAKLQKTYAQDGAAIAKPAESSKRAAKKQRELPLWLTHLQRFRTGGPNGPAVGPITAGRKDCLDVRVLGATRRKAAIVVPSPDPSGACEWWTLTMAVNKEKAVSSGPAGTPRPGWAVDGGRLVRGTAPDLEERRRRSSSMHDLALERSGAAHAAIASRESPSASDLDQVDVAKAAAAARPPSPPSGASGPSAEVVAAAEEEDEICLEICLAVVSDLLSACALMLKKSLAPGRGASVSDFQTELVSFFAGLDEQQASAAEETSEAAAAASEAALPTKALGSRARRPPARFAVAPSSPSPSSPASCRDFSASDEGSDDGGGEMASSTLAAPPTTPPVPAEGLVAEAVESLRQQQQQHEAGERAARQAAERILTEQLLARLEALALLPSETVREALEAYLETKMFSVVMWVIFGHYDIGSRVAKKLVETKLVGAIDDRAVQKITLDDVPEWGAVPPGWVAIPAGKFATMTSAIRWVRSEQRLSGDLTYHVLTRVLHTGGDVVAWLRSMAAACCLSEAEIDTLAEDIRRGTFSQATGEFFTKAAALCDWKQEQAQRRLAAQQVMNNNLAGGLPANGQLNLHQMFQQMAAPAQQAPGGNHGPVAAANAAQHILQAANLPVPQGAYAAFMAGRGRGRGGGGRGAAGGGRGGGGG